jgi:hypothetical protein
MMAMKRHGTHSGHLPIAEMMMPMKAETARIAIIA